MFSIMQITADLSGTSSVCIPLICVIGKIEACICFVDWDWLTLSMAKFYFKKIFPLSIFLWKDIILVGSLWWTVTVVYNMWHYCVFKLVHPPVFWQAQRFINWNSFHPQVTGGRHLLYWVRRKEGSSVTGPGSSEYQMMDQAQTCSNADDNFYCCKVKLINFNCWRSWESVFIYLKYQIYSSQLKWAS
jgi:hypothetical protein